VLNRVKELVMGGLTSMMVLGDFLRRRITPLQQRSRMACMYTGPNDCCRIARGPSSDFSRAELEAALRAMTGEAFSLESLVLPSGIKALCEDQALRSMVLASMPTLDEGGLAARQLGGNPNRGIHIPGTSHDRQEHASQGPGGPSPGGPAPAGKGKDKVPVPEHCTRTMRVLPRPGGTTRRSGQPHAEQPSRGVQVPEAPAWRRLLHGEGSPQTPEDGGGREAEQSSTTSAAAPSAGEEAGGGAAAFSGVADSSVATDDTAPSDTTTTVGAKTTNPTLGARSANCRCLTGCPPRDIPKVVSFG
jgi:hypothetical protein